MFKNVKGANKFFTGLYMLGYVQPTNFLYGKIQHGSLLQTILKNPRLSAVQKLDFYLAFPVWYAAGVISAANPHIATCWGFCTEEVTWFFSFPLHGFYISIMQNSVLYERQQGFPFEINECGFHKFWYTICSKIHVKVHQSELNFIGCVPLYMYLLS